MKVLHKLAAMDARNEYSMGKVNGGGNGANIIWGVVGVTMPKRMKIAELKMFTR